MAESLRELLMGCKSNWLAVVKEEGQTLTSVCPSNNNMMKFRILLPILALFLVGFAKKDPKATVRFHTEANQQDTEQFAATVALQNPPRQIFIQKVPFISENDVKAVFPFPATDGTMGCAFQLNAHGTLELDTQSIMRRGTVILAYINGRLITDMLMDKRVSDGVLMIPSGLTALEIASLQKRFRTLGDPKSKRSEGKAES